MSATQRVSTDVTSFSVATDLQSTIIYNVFKVPVLTYVIDTD